MADLNSLNKIRSELQIYNAKLVAVSKTKSEAEIHEVYNAGHKTFGENYVQELQYKQIHLPSDIEWHFIGHLQSNKVKYIAPFISLIQSVDTAGLLKEINNQAKKNNRIINCLLQVHIALEETKFGFSFDECESLLQSDELSLLNHISITGLMGMASFTQNQDQVRSEFKKLKKFYDKLSDKGNNLNILSMGMSSDYKIALEEGSNMIRIGSSIFGERYYKSKT